jgi:hypothetical protein
MYSAPRRQTRNQPVKSSAIDRYAGWRICAVVQVLISIAQRARVGQYRLIEVLLERAVADCVQEPPADRYMPLLRLELVKM